MKYLTAKDLYDYACSIGAENYPLIFDAPFEDRFFLTKQELEYFSDIIQSKITKSLIFEVKLNV